MDPVFVDRRSGHRFSQPVALYDVCVVFLTVLHEIGYSEDLVFGGDVVGTVELEPGAAALPLANAAELTLLILW